MDLKMLPAEITQLSEYRIAESKTFSKTKKNIDPQIYSKITSVAYPQLKANPHFGINIKRLKGSLKGYYRYRIGNYRLFYLIDNNNIVVVIIDLRNRKDAYK